MNSKIAKEIRQFIKEEMPSILESEYSKANHTKLAAEMREIVKEVIPSLLEDKAVAALQKTVLTAVMERMTELEKYVKESNEARAEKLEEALKKMMESQTSKE